MGCNCGGGAKSFNTVRPPSAPAAAVPAALGTPYTGIAAPSAGYAVAANPNKPPVAPVRTTI